MNIDWPYRAVVLMIFLDTPLDDFSRHTAEVRLAQRARDESSFSLWREHIALVIV
jgi:hypothetical protein